MFNWNESYSVSCNMKVFHLFLTGVATNLCVTISLCGETLYYTINWQPGEVLTERITLFYIFYYFQQFPYRELPRLTAVFISPESAFTYSSVPQSSAVIQKRLENPLLHRVTTFSVPAPATLKGSDTLSQELAQMKGCLLHTTTRWPHQSWGHLVVVKIFLYRNVWIRWR